MNSLPAFRMLRRPLPRELTAALMCALVVTQSLHAAAPGWWTSQGVLNAQKAPDDHAVLNQGQLKNFVRAAIYELHAKLPGGAGSVLNSMLQTWRAQKLGADDHAVVTLGQLKAVAKPVYEAMQVANVPVSLPWTAASSDDDDHAVANIGQAKRVFAFVVPDLVTLGMRDSDGDGFSDALEIALGTNPFSNASHPAGTGDLAWMNGGNAGGSGNAGTGGGGGGGGLPPYVDPYPEPWPDFEAAATADANKDSDNDGVKDSEDAVWYDDKFKHKRSGMPHYNIIDLGKCEGGFIDMADSGAMVWQENAAPDYPDPPQLRVWTPEHPGDANGPRQVVWNPYDFGLEDGTNGWTPEAISNEGKLAGRAQQIVEGLSSYRQRYYLYDPESGSASWLANPFPNEGSFQWVDSFDSKASFGPGGCLFGAVAYDIYPDENSDYRERYSAFYRLSTEDAVLDDQALQSDLPPLPEDPPGEDEPLGTRERLGGDGHANQRFGLTYYGHSGTGVIQVSQHTKFNVYKKVYASDPYNSDGDYWDYDFDCEDDDGPRINLEDIWTYQLATSNGVHVLKTQDVLAETRGIYHYFESVSPAEHPWVNYRVSEFETQDPGAAYLGTKAYIFKPDENGANYQPCAIYAGHKDYEDDKPIKDIGLITAQNQAIVYGDFDAEHAGDETGLWADGEVQLIDKLISGYERYAHDPADWLHQWQFHDVSRDGMIAATAWKEGDNGPEQRMLLLIPITTREIKEDGTLADSGGGVQASMPSPVFCDHVDGDGKPQETMSCKLESLRVLADGSIVGDLKVKGAIASKACDNVKGEKGTITQAQLWVNGAETPQATFTVQPDKQNSGSSARRPYPFKGTFGTTLSNVPLTAGVNTFKFTAHDPVYHMPGYSTWEVTINVTDPTSGGSTEPGSPAGSFALSVQLPAATLAADQAETVTATLSLDGTVHGNVQLTETSSSSGVFTGLLTDGRPARLTLADVAALSVTAQDDLQAVLLLGQPGSAVRYQTGVHETNRASGLFLGGYSAAMGGEGGGSSGGGATGGDPTPTGGSNGGGAAGGPAPVVTASDDPYEALDEVAKSNGGEFHRYAIVVGVPEALRQHFQMAFGEGGDEQEFGLMRDAESGLMVLKDPSQGGENVPFTPSFMPHCEEGGAQVEPQSDHDKRMDELKDEESFAKGFALGLGYGGLDMVKSTGETIVGAAKFVGRAHMQVGLRFKWAFNWAVGNDNTQTEVMIAQVDAKQQEVIDQGLAVGKFLGTLFVDTATAWGKIEVGLLTGDVALIQTALHGSETHRKIFAMAAEVITETLDDLQNGSPGQKGYVIGKIFFEVASALIPATKIGKIMQVTKADILGKLLGKPGLLKTKAFAKGTAVKAAVEASQMCFVAGTPVLTKSGWMRIEDVRVGMWVWSRDEHTGATGWKRVRHTFTTHPTELYRLTYELRGPPESGPLSPRAESETLGVTAPHPFWVSNREQPAFIEAEKLQAGDELLTADGRKAVVMSKALEEAPRGKTFTTYNFEVEDYHTYFAGRNAVWVHNHLNPGMPMCMRARAGIRSLSLNGHNTWDAYKGELALYSYDDLSNRARLRVFNEVRKEYLAGNWVGGMPPWNDLSRQLRGLGPLDSDSYWDQIDGVAGNSTLLGKNLKATGIEAPWGEDTGSLARAHHIVMGGSDYKSAKEAREILADAGIDINEAANGVFLPRSAEFIDLGKAIHNGYHPETYSVWVLNRLAPHKGNAAALRKELQKIAVDLVETGWP